jgi:holo-[acyl-carrier protein] synthase
MNFLKGVGVDIAKIPRFKRIIESHEASFIRKVLHENEIKEYSEIKLIDNKTEYLASRWSLKEALVKATGNRSIIFSKVYLEKNIEGKPFVKFDEKYIEENDQIKEIDGKIHMSISHEDDYAVAFVIIENTNKMI